MDVFAGCGGMTRGFVDTHRFMPIYAIEQEDDAAGTYAANFGSHVDIAPIEEIKTFPSVDVVIGGPPCQGFSPLNRDLVGWERRGLWREYLRVLQAVEPAAFVMENVPQLLKSAEYVEFADAATRLGYSVGGRTLNAADYGVPQRRLRAFVVGARIGRPRWPKQTHSDPERPVLGTEPWRTFRQAVAGLPRSPNGSNWHVGRRPRPDSLVRYRAVPLDGGNRFQMQEALDRQGRPDLVLPCFRRKQNGTTDVFGRLWWDRPAVTIRTEFYKPEKGRYLHPEEHRPITVREAARCMTFPDAFTFPADQSMTSVGRQIGNAVPPLLAQQVAEALAETLDAGISGTACIAAAA
jgi:DNA (cytosine-5)-methyltransferase 1